MTSFNYLFWQSEQKRLLLVTLNSLDKLFALHHLYSALLVCLFISLICTICHVPYATLSIFYIIFSFLFNVFFFFFFLHVLICIFVIVAFLCVHVCVCMCMCVCIYIYTGAGHIIRISSKSWFISVIPFKKWNLYNVYIHSTQTDIFQVFISFNFDDYEWN